MEIDEVVDLTKDDETDNNTNIKNTQHNKTDSTKTEEAGTTSQDTVVDLTSSDETNDNADQDGSGSSGGNAQNLQQVDNTTSLTSDVATLDGDKSSKLLGDDVTCIETKKEDTTQNQDKNDQQLKEIVDLTSSSKDEDSGDIKTEKKDSIPKLNTDVGQNDDFQNEGDCIINKSKTHLQELPVAEETRLDTEVHTDTEDKKISEEVDDVVDGGRCKKRALELSPDKCLLTKVSRIELSDETKKENKNLLDFPLDSKSSLDSLENLLEDPASDIPSLNVDVEVNISLDNPTGTTKSILTRADGPASGASSPFTDSLFNIVSEDMNADVHNDDISESTEGLDNEPNSKTKTAPKRGRGRRGRGNNGNNRSTRSTRPLNVTNFF